jgi:hypothetical protein
MRSQEVLRLSESSKCGVRSPECGSPKFRSADSSPGVRSAKFEVRMRVRRAQCEVRSRRCEFGVRSAKVRSADASPAC